MVADPIQLQEEIRDELKLTEVLVDDYHEQYDETQKHVELVLVDEDDDLDRLSELIDFIRNHHDDEARRMVTEIEIRVY
jgi:hypothetical protein